MRPAIQGMRPSDSGRTRADALRAAKLRRTRGRRRVWLGIVVLLLASAAAAGFYVIQHRPLLADDFNRANGLVTNEFAYFNPGNPAAVTSPIWMVTSGSLFVHDNAAWTGVPDRGRPGPRSATMTDSAVFRVVTRRADLQNVAVSFSLRVERFATAPPGLTWQGVHAFVRYQNPNLLYVISVDRRDGDILIKKKVPGGTADGGTYYTIATGKAAAALGKWQQVRVSAVNTSEGGVELQLWLDGRLRLHGVDNGYGDVAPITQPGRVGLRGDYTEFSFDDFAVNRA